MTRRSRFHSWLSFLLFLAIVLWPNLAPAPSSGGSMGGSGFGGGGGGGSSDGAGALIEILFYLIYYGGHLFFTTTPGFVIFLIIVAIVIYVGITGKKKGAMTTGSHTSGARMSMADVGGRKGGPYVVMLQLAFPAAGFRLREQFNQLASKESGRLQSRAGLADLLIKCCHLLDGVAGTARVATLREDGPLSTLKDLETRFQQVSAEERGRYRRDTIRAEQGQVVVNQHDQLTNETARGYVVVTLIGAYGRPMPVEVVAPTDVDKLRQTLKSIAQVTTGSTLYALEVVWTPAAKGDVLEEAELLALFPALKGAAGAQATVFACPFCGASYDAALPTCPTCGGANTGAIS